MQPDNDPSAPPLHPGWRASPTWWFRRVGIPLLALTLIAGAMVWLQRPQRETTYSVAGADAPQTADTGTPRDGDEAPDFMLATLDGATMRLSDYRGRVVLLNFWATWCAPCRAEMPLFESATREVENASDLVILAVNVEERTAAVEPFVQRLGLGYPILLDLNGAVSRRYHIRSFPTTYFIGRDGRIEGRRVGQYTRPILYGRLEQLLDTR